MGWQWSSCRSFERLGQRCRKPQAFAFAPREPSLLPVWSILVQMAGIEPLSAGWLKKILRNLSPNHRALACCIRTAAFRLEPVLADTGSDCSTIELHLRNWWDRCRASTPGMALAAGLEPCTPGLEIACAFPELSLLLTPSHLSFPGPRGSVDMVYSFHP